MEINLAFYVTELTEKNEMNLPNRDLEGGKKMKQKGSEREKGNKSDLGLLKTKHKFRRFSTSGGTGNDGKSGRDVVSRKRRRDFLMAGGER